MALVRSRGTALKCTVSSALVTIAQLLSIDFGEMKQETFECDTLDSASVGIEKANTGRVDGGKVSGEMYFDPALASHSAFWNLVRTPFDSSNNPVVVPCAIVFANPTANTIAFKGVGFGIGITAALKEGLKAKFSIEITGLPSMA